LLNAVLGRHRGAVETVLAQARTSKLVGLTAALEAEAAHLTRRANRPTDARAIALRRINADLDQRRAEAFFDAEDARRRAAEHGAEEPQGLTARLSGNHARWQAEKSRLDRAAEVGDGRLAETRAAFDRALAAVQREASGIAATNRAANVADLRRARDLQQIAQAVRAGHMPLMEVLARRPLRGAGRGDDVDLRHLTAVAAQPGFFAALDGTDPDAAARFLRQWSAQMGAKQCG
jgi:hypothetical protein